MSDQSFVEARSFDFVPEHERHGNVRSQVQFWFMINATLITLYTGAVGPSFGLGLPWTLLAVVVGSIAGTLFQAFHGAQGPRMGLPQMIQSRVQFGSRGAIIPLVAAMITQFGFAIFFIQTGAQAVVDMTGVERFGLFQVAIGFVAMLVAIVGYNLVMKVEKYASYATLINLIFLTLAAVLYLPFGTMFADTKFSLLPFLAQLGASASYQLAIAPIVSDYTRYLPSRISGAAVSAAVFCGTMASAIWLQSLGAALAISSPGQDVIRSVYMLGQSFGFGLSTATMVIAAIACLITAAVTYYSGSVTVLSAGEAFRTFRSTGLLRSITILIGACVAIAASLSLTAGILASFSAFLSLLGYFLIPWTAVNLTDYYFIRRGQYSISDILRADGGIYGRWAFSGLASYALGFLCMIPFFSTPLYTGPIAQLLGGADLSFAVGLIVASISYVLMTRQHNFHEELAAVRAAPLNTIDEQRESGSGFSRMENEMA
jgi:NCS1 family nucleobase:cation symporter-1